MKFLIANKYSIAHLKPEANHIVISIYKPGDSFPDLPKNNSRISLLQLKFADLDRVDIAEQTGQEHMLMTKDQAKEILRFVDKYKDRVNLIICQCDGGVSRSSGTAAALSKILNGDDSWVFDSKSYIPNMYIYRLLISEYFM